MCSKKVNISARASDHHTQQQAFFGWAICDGGKEMKEKMVKPCFHVCCSQRGRKLTM